MSSDDGREERWILDPVDLARLAQDPVSLPRGEGCSGM
jgi:hypothetical protein